MTFSIGARLGPYEVIDLLGTGGMGEVYRARDTKLGREVAIKIVRSAFALDDDHLQRFNREARLLASLNHPHIGSIYGLEEAEGVRALVLELIEGDTLAERLRRGPVPLPEALTIARQICDALDAAHERGIVHRDLKPANIKITPDGVVKVLDFGLAKSAAADASDPLESATVTVRGTRAGVILGTAAYMSPEQARGRTVDKRTDIWAFGCVLYEMLTGRAPFLGETVSDTIATILEREPDWSSLPESTSAEIRRLLRRCLEKDPKHRLRDIGDAQIELDGATGPNVPPTRKRYVLVSALAAIATGAIAMAIWNQAAARDTTASIALGRRFSRLTWDASFSTQPALSPDGTLVVYASDRDGAGQLDLWLQRIAGGQPIRLTNDPADDREPDFSADGNLIAFRSDRNGGGIYVIPVLGGDARLVAERGRAPRFSPDGTRIAYWGGSWLGGPRIEGTALFLVPSVGGQSTRLAAGFASARDPVWSPDGRSLLFFGRKSVESSPSGGFDWWWMSLDNPLPVATGAYQVFAHNGLYGTAENNTVTPAPDALPAVWTPEGVVFSARLEQSVNLWRVKVSERAGKVIDGSLERLTYGAGSDMLPSGDRRGRLAFQVSSRTIVSLTLPLDPNAGKALGAIQGQSADSGFSDGRNSLDATGRLLVYPRVHTTESEIWLKDLRTGHERHLVTTPLSQLNPVIAPDGTKVAYTVSEGDRISGYVIAVAGGTSTKVCDACNLHGWLADNRRIIALMTSAREHVRIVDVVDGSAREALVDPTSAIGRVDVSPDSHWLAFTIHQRLWIAPLGPGKPAGEADWVPVLSLAQGSAERACGWSPDGRLLYLLLERDGFRDLYAQRVDVARGRPVGEPFLVQHLHDPRRVWGSTPYGTAIVSNAFVFHQAELTGSIWLLDSAR